MKTVHATELDELCARALDAFELDLATLPSASELPRLVVLKHDDQSMVIRSVCGDGDQIFILKYVVESEFYGSEATASIQELLGGDSRGRRAKSGQFLFRDSLSDGRRAVWSVNSFVPNSPSFDWLDAHPEWHEGHVDSAGELLSHIHQNATQHAATFNSRQFKEIPSASANIVNWLSSSLATRLDKADLSSLVEQEVRKLVLRKVREAVLHTGGNLHGAWSKRPKIMIHGDYHPGNVLFQGDQAICAIDWDFAHMGDAMLDVAYGLIMFCGIAPRDAEIFDVRMANAFLQGYTRGYEHRAALPHGLTSESFVECQRDRYGPLNQYLKIAAALILVWSLSSPGLQHHRGALVREVAVRLILADAYA